LDLHRYDPYYVEAINLEQEFPNSFLETQFLDFTFSDQTTDNSYLGKRFLLCLVFLLAGHQ
ncbi:hypothetical protein, partial [Nitrosomonas sp. Is37]|uniref:hypothetical protein n=1 Tax=Nitrosomonas sp. Is37 TaxID=3080535 RepID=UPI00294B8CE0